MCSESQKNVEYLSISVESLEVTEVKELSLTSPPEKISN